MINVWYALVITNADKLKLYCVTASMNSIINVFRVGWVNKKCVHYVNKKYCKMIIQW